jgi:hypothetical protein
MKEKLKDFDTLGHGEFLSYNGRSKYNTFLGGIFTIISYLVILGITIWYLFKLIDRSNPQLVFQQKTISNWTGIYKEEDINFGLFPVFFKVFYMKKDNRTPRPLNLSNLHANLFKYKISTDETGEIIRLSQCHLKDFLPKDQEYINDNKIIPLNGNSIKNTPPTDFLMKDGEYFLCANTTNYVLSTFLNEATYNIYITFDYTEEDKNYLDSILMIDIHYLYNEFDVSSYPVANSHIIKKYGQMQSPIGKIFSSTFKFNEIVIETDIGWLLEDTKKENTYTVSDPILPGSVNNDIPNNSFIQLLYTRDDIMTTYSRSYKKVPDFLSDVGGFLGLVKAFFSTLYGPFTELLFRLNIINSVFGFKTKHARGNYDLSRERTDLPKLRKKNIQGSSLGLEKVDKAKIYNMSEGQNINEWKQAEGLANVEKKCNENHIPVSTKSPEFVENDKKVENTNSNAENKIELKEIKLTERAEENQLIVDNKNEEGRRTRGFLRKMLIINKIDSSFEKLSFGSWESILVAWAPFFISNNSNLYRKKYIYDNLWKMIEFEYLNVREMVQNFITVDEVEILLAKQLKTKEKIIYEENKFSVVEYIA